MILEYKNNCIILHNDNGLFSTHYNQWKIYKSRIVSKNDYFIHNFPEKDAIHQIPLGLQIQNFTKIFKNKSCIAR